MSLKSYLKIFVLILFRKVKKGFENYKYLSQNLINTSFVIS